MLVVYLHCHCLPAGLPARTLTHKPTHKPTHEPSVHARTGQEVAVQPSVTPEALKAQHQCGLQDSLPQEQL